ncbi:uncharacterized protein LOC135844330 [Planococcus citri]|uniref:uncharacterized protein LOC135844330 n=1 Tax=Planococcus citri TaxID=170843 RepID=UPI0031F99F88
MLYFYTTMRISIFIWLQLTDIFSTQEIRLQNDITQQLNAWIPSIFEINDKNATDIICISLNRHRLKRFEDLHTKFYFVNIYFHIKHKKNKASQILWKFQENNIMAFFEKLNFEMNLRAKVPLGNSTIISDANIYPTFNNFTFTAIASYTDDDSKITYNISNITHSGIDSWQQNEWWNPDLTNPDKNQLEVEIKRAAPTILQQILNNNQNFSGKLDEIFQVYEKSRKEIISTYADFSNNSQKYFYHIPQIPLFCFTLKHIVISGLTNFESYEVGRGISGNFVHSLLVRNIQGTLSLDYGFENEPDLDLRFQIDRFTLSKKHGTADDVHGQAKYYKVTRTKSNILLSDRHSEVIMNRLESALATALLSLNKAWKACDIECEIGQIEITNSSDWRTIVEKYSDWIPFNQVDETLK